MMSSTRFLSKIKDVQQFLVIGDMEFCLKDKRVTIYKKGKPEGEFQFNTNSFYKYDRLLFSGKNFYFSIPAGEVVEMSDLTGYYFTNLFYKRLILFTGEYQLVYDFENNHIVVQEPLLDDRSPWIMNENGFVCKGKSFLSFYDFLKGQHVWKHDYSALLSGKSIKNLGNLHLVGNNLYCWLSDDKNPQNNSTFCINVQTGEVKHEYKDFGGDLTLFNEKFIGVAGSREVAILNTQTHEIKRHDLSADLMPHNITIGWNSNVFSDDGRLYFIGTLDSKNQIGIIDLNTQSLIWHTAIDIPEGDYNINQQVMSITIQNNLLYAHCSDYTVHIFELA